MSARPSTRLTPCIAPTILMLVFLLLHFNPLRSDLCIGPDEGYELAKATLCLKGHALYTEVWNDQPPLHTFLVVQILKHISPFILGPRLLTVGATCLLLAAFFSMVRKLSGAWPAAIATVLFIASPGFLELSSSCMVEIPALAPAVAALCVLLVGSEKRWHRNEIIAGILFGISFQIKFITVVLVPLALLAIWLRSGRRDAPMRRALIGGAIIIAAIIPVFVVLNQVADGGSLLLQFKQSWAAHFASTRSFEYGSAADKPFDWGILLRNWDLTIPMVVGLVLVSRRSLLSRQRIAKGGSPGFAAGAPLDSKENPGLGWFPFIWLGLSLVVFGTHKPWWPCYYVHNALPLCWCAAVGIVELAGVGGLGAVFGRAGRPARGAEQCSALYRGAAHGRVSGAKRNRLLLIAFTAYAVSAVGWLGSRLYLEVTGIRNLPKIENSLVLKEIQRAKPFADWLYTEEPIYSFHADIPMPPQLAVVALKRFWSGDMTNARLASELWKLKPSIMLLWNDSVQRPFEDLLAAHYRLVYVDQEHRVYLRSDVATEAGT